MPRLRYIEDSEKTPHTRELIESAKRTGAPDPRLASLMTRSKLGIEKAALHYADLFKQGEHSIDKDEVYAELAKHFSDEEIIELGLFCAEVDGVGKFVKSLNVVSWEEACELNPSLNATATRAVAAE